MECQIHVKSSKGLEFQLLVDCNRYNYRAEIIFWTMFHLQYFRRRRGTCFGLRDGKQLDGLPSPAFRL